jgi:hypothetical protein
MPCYTAFPDYPLHAMPALPDGWADVSRQGDFCPCYATSTGVRVWIGAPPPATECHGYIRFLVERDGETMFATPRWEYVLSRIAAYETGAAAWRNGWI